MITVDYQDSYDHHRDMDDHHQYVDDHHQDVDDHHQQVDDHHQDVHHLQISKLCLSLVGGFPWSEFATS